MVGDGEGSTSVFRSSRVQEKYLARPNLSEPTSEKQDGSRAAGNAEGWRAVDVRRPRSDRIQTHDSRVDSSGSTNASMTTSHRGGRACSGFGSVGTFRALCLVVVREQRLTFFAPSPCLRPSSPCFTPLRSPSWLLSESLDSTWPSRALTPVAWADVGVVRASRSASANSGASLLFSIPAVWARSETRGASAAASAEVIVSWMNGSESVVTSFLRSVRASSDSRARSARVCCDSRTEPRKHFFWKSDDILEGDFVQEFFARTRLARRIDVDGGLLRPPILDSRAQ